MIKSPVDGTVVARSKLAGDLAVPGAPILTLESEHGLLFEAFVDVGIKNRWPPLPWANRSRSESTG